MRKYLPPHRHLNDDEKQQAKSKLAKEVLYEVPAQLISYMKSKGIYPRSVAEPFELVDEMSNTPSRSGSTKSIKGKNWKYYTIF